MHLLCRICRKRERDREKERDRDRDKDKDKDRDRDRDKDRGWDTALSDDFDNQERQVSAMTMLNRKRASVIARTK